jgi:hypothetical protein
LGLGCFGVLAQHIPAFPAEPLSFHDGITTLKADFLIYFDQQTAALSAEFLAGSNMAIRTASHHLAFFSPA